MPTTLRPDKAKKFMRKARFQAQQFSKDASTQVGAVFLDPTDFTELTQGYNGMPRGVNEAVPERHERPTKYAWYEHAERNAIYNLARRELKGTMAILTVPPSTSDARALVSVGVSEVYFPVPDETHPGLDVITQLFNESGVTVHHTFGPSVLGMTGRKGRKIGNYLALAHALPTLLGKDPRGDAALFLTSTDFTQIAQGYSGLPRGADDSQAQRYEGELRAQWVESSVRNAIFNLVRPVLKGSVAVVTATTCVECARAIACVGSGQVVYQEPDSEFVARWGGSIKTALDMLRELQVCTTVLPKDSE